VPLNIYSQQIETSAAHQRTRATSDMNCAFLFPMSFVVASAPVVSSKGTNYSQLKAFLFYFPLDPGDARAICPYAT
jgi:hypothetical protein